MERQFEIIRPDYRKLVLVWLLGVGLFGLVVAMEYGLLVRTDYLKTAVGLVLLVAMLGIFIPINWTACKRSRRPTRVTVVPDKLIIRTFEAGTAQEQQVPFQTIATYRYTTGAWGSETLCLTLRDGRQLTLSANFEPARPAAFC